MYGQADVCFTPSVNSAPIITSAPVTLAVQDQAYTYAVTATDPDGDSMTFSLTQSPSGMVINAVTGVISWTPTAAQQGNNAVTVKVQDSNGNSSSQVFTVTVGSSTSAQTPWSSNENGSVAVNYAWNYTMGYHFTPSKDGQITKLGGYFNGTKTVYLWDKDSGALLAQAQVTSTNGWSYTGITPVAVQSGKNYTVAVYIGGSGGSYRYNITEFPQTYGDITISGSSYIYGYGVSRPTDTFTTRMYGQADVMFKLN